MTRKRSAIFIEYPLTIGLLRLDFDRRLTLQFRGMETRKTLIFFAPLRKDLDLWLPRSTFTKPDFRIIVRSTKHNWSDPTTHRKWHLGYLMHCRRTNTCFSACPPEPIHRDWSF